ncbi:MAG: hypothetical protein D6689_12645 [Deltaproteobacteria bacterium]|nr:MAG: hypothetical protein D6689_12645 [Deltaproteobacteria bacterium]
MPLVFARLRAFAGGAVGLAIGVLLVWRFGAVGKVIGAAIAAWSAFVVRAGILSLAHPPAAIGIGDGAVELPKTPYRPAPVKVELDDVRHVYLLRRAVPWSQTGPLLVIETAQGDFAYPRDWFDSESAQARVAELIHDRIGRRSPP